MRFPLSAFEHYMILDDTPHHPMTCAIRFFLRGALDVPLLKGAIEAECREHPLFRVRLDAGQRDWVYDDALPGCQVSVLPPGSPLQAPREAIDLKSGATPRFTIQATGDDLWILDVAFHHATADGIGIFEVFERVLKRYTDGESKSATALPLAKLIGDLAERDRWPSPPLDKSARLRRAKRIIKHFSKLPIGLFTTSPPPSKVAALNASARLRSQPELVTQGLAICKKAKITFNDFLLAAFFRTLHRHNAASGRQMDGPLRIAVATSLREERHVGLSACNVVSMVFLDRKWSQIGSLHDLTNSIKREMDEIKVYRLAEALIRVFRVGMRLPVLSRLILRAPVRHASAVLTNLGLPFRESTLRGTDGLLHAGGLTLDNLETWPPLRPRTPLSVSVNTYGGRLSISGRYDTTAMSEDQATALVSRFMNEIVTTQVEWENSMSVSPTSDQKKSSAPALSGLTKPQTLRSLALAVTTSFAAWSGQAAYSQGNAAPQPNMDESVPLETIPPEEAASRAPTPTPTVTPAGDPVNGPTSETPPHPPVAVPTPVPDAPADTGVATAVEGEPAATSLQPLGDRPASDVVWFPDWPEPPFGWSIGPVVAFKYGAEERSDIGRAQVTTAEIGVLGSVSHIPVVKGQPGDWLSPFAGTAWGYSYARAADQSDKSHYTRSWVGIQNRFQYGPYKYDLTLSRGRLDYPEKRDLLTQTFTVNNDFGVLFLDWFSGHYTLNYQRGFHNQFNTPFLTEYDNWVHARTKYDFMDLILDLGPGFTQSKVYQQDADTLLAEGLTRYVKGTLDFNLLFGLGGTGLAKYAFDSSESRLGVYDRRRLPQEALNEPPTIVMPEDSFEGSLFLGFKEIIFGIGFGWRYNIQIIALGGRHDRERQTTTDSGFGLYKEVRF